MILICKYFYYPHSADKANEVDIQKMWPKSGSCELAEAEFEPRPQHPAANCIAQSDKGVMLAICNWFLVSALLRKTWKSKTS